jgi:AraC-like DNA-binding protein
MLVERKPCRLLMPWVSRIWAAEEPPADPSALRWRERLVPRGGFHLVLRLDDSRIRIFDGVDDGHGRTFVSVIGGARSRFHVREAAGGARAVGMLIRPGAAGVILGVPAHELAERHTAFEDVWGRAAHALRDRLLAARTPARQLAILERTIAARLALRYAPHAAVRVALSRFGSDATGWEVGPVCRETGLSHRRFIALFRRDVGLGPKQLCRVLRLERAMQIARSAVSPSWAETAATAGYCDQAHLVRELRALAGVSPTQWLALARDNTHHIRVVNFVQDGRGERA